MTTPRQTLLTLISQWEVKYDRPVQPSKLRDWIAQAFEGSEEKRSSEPVGAAVEWPPTPGLWRRHDSFFAVLCSPRKLSACIVRDAYGDGPWLEEVDAPSLRGHWREVLTVSAMELDAECGKLNATIDALTKRVIEAEGKAGERPRIVCLCGSTRFKSEFEEAEAALTITGQIVLTVGCFGHADGISFHPGTKEKLDELHLRKIELADEVFIINVGGYIGESTRREIEHAKKLGKPLRWFDSLKPARLEMPARPSLVGRQNPDGSATFTEAPKPLNPFEQLKARVDLLEQRLNTQSGHISAIASKLSIDAGNHILPQGHD